MASTESPSIILSQGDTTLFTATGRWLHPLFALRTFLQEHQDIPVAQCHLHDRLIGKAAALLIVGLGIRSVSTDLLSDLGREVFQRRGIPVTAAAEVDRIACATEELLFPVNDPDEAWRIIENRLREHAAP